MWVRDNPIKTYTRYSKWLRLKYVVNCSVCHKICSLRVISGLYCPRKIELNYYRINASYPVFINSDY